MLTSRLKNAFNRYATHHLMRKREVITHKNACSITINNRRLLNFCSNDYLNLSTHPEVIQAFSHGAIEHGIGSGASPMIAGYSNYHHALEEKFAAFLGRDKALLFNSGYHANLGCVSSFANRESIIIADKLCHASLDDAMILSRAKFHRYRHLDLNHAEFFLKQHAEREPILITESVFSMEGDIADIKQCVTLAKKYHAKLIVDDAHGIGVLGANGKGICEYAHVSQREVPCLVLPLGKALGGMGAIVAGDHDSMEVLLQFARSYCYSTALPAAMCAGLSKALDIMQHENWRQEKLRALTQFFLKEAKARDLCLASYAETPIHSVMIGCNQKTLLLQKKLYDVGYFVSCIRPPTIPKNSSRIRITLNALHTEENILALLDHLKENIDKIENANNA